MGTVGGGGTSRWERSLSPLPSLKKKKKKKNKTQNNLLALLHLSEVSPGALWSLASLLVCHSLEWSTRCHRVLPPLQSATPNTINKRLAQAFRLSQTLQARLPPVWEGVRLPAPGQELQDRALAKPPGASTVLTLPGQEGAGRQKRKCSDLDENQTAVARVPEESTLFITIMLGPQSLPTDHTDCEQSFTISQDLWWLYPLRHSVGPNKICFRVNTKKFILNEYFFKFLF